MARQNLNRLQTMCKNAGKSIPKEWPEGLIGVGPDMRVWVKTQEDAPKKVAPAKKTLVKKAEKSE
jgi:hypothetical protein